MENVTGEEIERALMDLGPLLGVTIKEEVADELSDAAAGSTSRQNVNSLPDGTTGSGSVASESGKDNAESADSLASPGASPRNSILNTRCVFCQNLLTQLDGTPKLMECLHSACETCIKQKIEEKQAANRDYLGGGLTITCPVCRLQCHPHNMIDQRFIIEKVTAEQAGNNTIVSGDQQCNSCEDTEPATSYCVDCAEFICDNCVHAHQRLKITKDHTIKSKDEAVAELQATQLASGAHEMNCSEHPQERLSLFCETCDRLTCRDCQLQHHRDHKYQFTSEMAVQAREAMSSLRAEVRYKRQLLGSAMKVIHDRQAAIGDKKKALVHDITTTVVKLTNAINTRGKQLVLRLNEVCDAKQRTLSEKKEALEQLATITDHCLQFVEAALRHGSDTAVLHSKRAVCAHLQRIKARRADIPNPDIPVRITLALDKLPELLRVLAGVGAIVVDGKVDGAGPYRPPSPAPPPSPANHPANHPAPPHSAVVALQHVAMQQSYVQSRSGGASPVGAVGGGGYLQLQQQMRARAHTPLRHPHVTSTTHPHHLHGMNELNLRGLLAASAGAPASRAPHPPHPAHPASIPTVHPARTSPAHAAHQMQHAYHHMMGAYGATVGMSGAAVFAGRARGSGGGGGPRAPSPAPHYPPPAKWHIPQQLHNGGFEAATAAAAGGVGISGGGAGGADFKITLGRPPHVARAPSSAVTSTNPKTPSPSLNGGVSSELDKVCAESVQDLMATIAKLDSNGVQVLPEHASAPQHAPHAVHAASPAPHVHSSTDDQSVVPANRVVGPAAAPTQGTDPNEDWCAVCMDGGELMCCDKCPKVFHQYCHIPTIEKLPDETETWQCLLCVNFAELPPEEDTPTSGGLSPRTQKVVERITLELYCQYECSLPFREPVPPENLLYHSKISRPMCLDMIRMKLQPTSPLRYTQVAQFVSDCRLLFRNAYHFNPPDSQLHKDARRLEEFFDAQLLKWLPEYAYWSGEGEIDPSHMAKRPRLH